VVRTPVSDVDANSEQEDTLARRILHMLGPGTVTRTWRGGQIDGSGRARRSLLPARCWAPCVGHRATLALSPGVIVGDRGQPLRRVAQARSSAVVGSGAAGGVRALAREDHGALACLGGINDGRAGSGKLLRAREFTAAAGDTGDRHAMSQRSRTAAALISALCAAAGLAFAVMLPGSGAGADHADVPCTALPSVALTQHSHRGTHGHPAPSTCASTLPVSSAAVPPPQATPPASGWAWTTAPGPASTATLAPTPPHTVSSMPTGRTAATLRTDTGSSQPVSRASVPAAESMSAQPGFLEVAAAPPADKSPTLIAVGIAITLAAAGIVLVVGRRGRRHDTALAALGGTGEDIAATDILSWDHDRITDQPDRLRAPPAHRARHRLGARHGQMSPVSPRHRASSSPN
jgi:hypothetical protein